MSQQTLTEQQVAEARELWAKGWTLGQVAEAVGCSVYDLSPWLYQDELSLAERGPDQSNTEPDGWHYKRVAMSQSCARIWDDPGRWRLVRKRLWRCLWLTVIFPHVHHPSEDE